MITTTTDSKPPMSRAIPLKRNHILENIVHTSLREFPPACNDYQEQGQACVQVHFRRRSEQVFFYPFSSSKGSGSRSEGERALAVLMPQAQAAGVSGRGCAAVARRCYGSSDRFPSRRQIPVSNARQCPVV